MKSRVLIRVNGRRWKQVKTFAKSGPTDRHYVLEVSGDKTTIVFGKRRSGRAALSWFERGGHVPDGFRECRQRQRRERRRNLPGSYQTNAGPDSLGSHTQQNECNQLPEI